MSYCCADPPAKTANGTPIPTGAYFVELTAHSTNSAYRDGKAYGAKVYHVAYSAFDYDKLAHKHADSDRRQMKSSRVYDGGRPASVVAAMQQVPGLRAYTPNLGAMPASP